MMIDDGGSSSGEAARRAAEEAARRAAEEAARRAAETARLEAQQTAEAEAAEQAFRARPAQPVHASVQAPTDTRETAPPPNRFTKDDVVTPAHVDTTAPTYHVDASGTRLQAADTPVRDDWYHDPSFEAPAAARQEDEIAVAQEAQARATRSVDARIAAAMDEAGPNAREAAILLRQRDRLIEAETRSTVQEFRDTRDAGALADEYAKDPARWQEAARQMGLPPAAQPDAVAIKDFLQFSRNLDAQAEVAGEVAASRLPASASAADRAAARAEAAARSRLTGILDRASSEPSGPDPQAWVDDQARQAAEMARERQRALAAGLDPEQAVQQSSRLYEMQLDAGLRSGAIDLEGATASQVAEWKQREVSRFEEAVALAKAKGLDVDEARSRIAQAYEVQDRRVAAQVQINDLATAYNESTTAVQRGGTKILDAVFGGGLNQMDWALSEFAQIEDLERQYRAILMGGEGTLTEARQQEADLLDAEITRRIDAAAARAGLTAQTSQQRAYGMSFVETGLYTVVYTGSAALGPLGLLTGGVTKAFLDDLPNGRIRNEGNVWETAGDLTLSAGLGVGQVAVSRFNPYGGGITARAVGLDALVNTGSGVAQDLVNQIRDDKAGIDWQHVALAGGASGGGALLGRAMGLPLGPQAGPISSRAFQAVAGASSASILDAGMQYATTGKVDPWQALDAAGHGAVGALAYVDPIVLGREKKPAAPDAAPPQPEAPPRLDLSRGVASPEGLSSVEGLLESGSRPSYAQALRLRDDLRAALDTRELSPAVRGRMEAVHSQLTGVLQAYRAEGAPAPSGSVFDPLASVERLHEAGLTTGIDRDVEAGRYPNGVDPAHLAERQRQQLAEIDPAGMVPDADRSLPVDWVHAWDYLTRRTWDQYFEFNDIYQAGAVHGSKDGWVALKRAPDLASPLEVVRLDTGEYLDGIDMDPGFHGQQLVLSVSCKAAHLPDGGGPSVAHAIAERTQRPVLASEDLVALTSRADGVRVWSSSGPWSLTHPDGTVEPLTPADVQRRFPFVQWDH